MSDADDEELIYTNTGLYDYLTQEGYTNFNVIDPKQKQITRPKSVSEFVTNHSNFYYEACNKFQHSSQMQCFRHCQLHRTILLQSMLMFEDDMTIVASLTFNAENETSIKPRFLMNLRTITILMGSWCILRWRIKRPSVCFSLSLIPIVGFFIKYLYDTSSCYFYQQKIQLLVDSLKKYSTLFQKCTVYLHDWEILQYDNPVMKNQMKRIFKYKVDSQNDKLDAYMMMGFKKNLLESMIQMIDCLKQATLNLIHVFPLDENVDQISFHLSYLNNDEIGIDCRDISLNALQKLKYIYLLLQSEFVRRLCLCFDPKLWIKPQMQSMRGVYDTVTNLIENSKSHYEKLNKKFRINFCFKEIDNTKTSNNNYYYTIKKLQHVKLNDIYVQIHDLSNHLQILLMHCRNLEEFVENSNYEDDDGKFCKIDEKLNFMLERYDKCKPIFDHLIMQVSSPKQEKNSDVAFEKIERNEINETVISVGISDFTPKWPDQIFQGLSSTTIINNDSDAKNADDAYFGTQNVYPTGLIQELKIALKNKQEEWKKREKAALKNKNFEDLSSSEDEEEQLAPRGDNSYKKCISSEKVEPDDNKKLVEHFDGDLIIVDKSEINKSQSTLANEIANISLKWGLNVEEHYSDDNNDE